MDFGGSKSRSKKRRVANKENISDDHDSNLQFYKIPPTETISLYEFEDYAVERLRVLKAIENAGSKYIKGTENYESHVREELKKTAFKSFVTSTSDEDEQNQARKVDHISHFILRLAYCRSEELRRWFLQQEMDLFRFRFQYSNNKEEKKKFLEDNNLHYEPMSPEEKNSLMEKLAAAGNMNASTVDTKEYFKVPFTEALDLVSRRKVYIQKGQAYVPYDDMISILIAVYRTHLSQALAVTARALPHLEEDERLLPMLVGLSKRYLGSDYSVKKNNVGQVTADMIDMLAKKSFPPCMQQLHTSMRRDHHLRHGGRQQYGLFLKGIGLSLEEAMKFWRNEFMKIIDGDKFDKQYSYNIRHNYGKEGKRADYTPYSCIKIIMSNTPGPGDSHGCPFRHTDLDLLKQKLKAMSIGTVYYDKIIESLKGGHYQVACTRYFEATHKREVESIQSSISHPNQYFEESRKGEGETPAGSSSTSMGTPKTPKSQRSVVSSQSTPGPVSQDSTSSTTQLSGIEEMDDDFDMDAAEQSINLP